ncbi:hypothetical protein LTR78_008001 [Recurvomyces mirabilis]|uniref:Secreted protein n=1 Tax=Recurvomyces mirabilis TaxID=574656 RepID=A0AAE0WJ06_9PEZI|nr:hypothetical protein LTR78_008001 [Recurvomyces mirabilis]KAK5150729.1 hypothetical protein LTS14_009791 [Recurvomyces mirabilis]
MKPLITITLLLALLLTHLITCAMIHGPPVFHDRNGTIQAMRNFSTITLHQRITVTTRSTMTRYQHLMPHPDCVEACSKWHVGSGELSEVATEEVSESAVSEAAAGSSEVTEQQADSGNESAHEIAPKPNGWGLYAKISAFFADLAYGTYGTGASRSKRDKEL